MADVETSSWVCTELGEALLHYTWVCRVSEEQPKSFWNKAKWVNCFVWIKKHFPKQWEASFPCYLNELLQCFILKWPDKESSAVDESKVKDRQIRELIYPLSLIPHEPQWIVLSSLLFQLSCHHICIILCSWPRPWGQNKVPVPAWKCEDPEKDREGSLLSSKALCMSLSYKLLASAQAQPLFPL